MLAAPGRHAGIYLPACRQPPGPLACTHTTCTAHAHRLRVCRSAFSPPSLAPCLMWGRSPTLISISVNGPPAGAQPALSKPLPLGPAAWPLLPAAWPLLPAASAAEPHAASRNQVDSRCGGLRTPRSCTAEHGHGAAGCENCSLPAKLRFQAVSQASSKRTHNLQGDAAPLDASPWNPSPASPCIPSRLA